MNNFFGISFTAALKLYARSIGGSIMPLTALLMPVLLGMVGVGVDVSVWLMDKHKLQTAVDAAVLAAAWEIASGDGQNLAYEAALAEARNNGYTGGDFTLAYGEDSEGQTTITTTLSQASNIYFSKVIYRGDISTSARAGAVVALPTGDFCMLSLDRNARTSFVIDGSADVVSENCGLAVNSNASPALDINGGAGTIEVGDISVVGTISGEGNIDSASSVQTGVSPFADPYADLDIPDFDECTEGEVDAGPVDAAGLAGLSSDANGVTVICGGLNLGNGDAVSLDPGIYIVDGGDLAVKNGATLTGDGVTIILTNSGGSDYGDYGNFDVDGGLDITAPAPGDISSDDWDQYEGIALYQDRASPYQTEIHCNALYGDLVVNGTVYAPSVCLDIGGNGGAAGSSCSRVIASTITIHGNPGVGNDCEGTGVEDIGTYTARLYL